MKGRSVRENTVLSFQKAATNMVDFVEFDVHVTADGEVVCFHDFEVKLGIGSEVIRLGIPALSYSQLKRCGATRLLLPRDSSAVPRALFKQIPGMDGCTTYPKDPGGPCTLKP